MKAYCKRDKTQAIKVYDRELQENKAPTVCPICGILYDDFRTGEKFSTIKDMLWVGDEDPENWRYKRRNTVLGLWHQLKEKLWLDHIEMHDDEDDDYYEDEDIDTSDWEF